MRSLGAGGDLEEGNLLTLLDGHLLQILSLRFATTTPPSSYTQAEDARQTLFWQPQTVLRL